MQVWRTDMVIDRFRLCRFLAAITVAGLVGACSEEPPTREEVSRPVKMMTLGEAELGA